MVALFLPADNPDPILGEFCSVGCTLASVEALPDTTVIPENVVLGVCVNPKDHDDAQLISILIEMEAIASKVQTQDPPIPRPRELN